MRTPAALVAVPLLIGSATGLLLFDLQAGSSALCGAGAAALALVAAAGCFADGDARGVAAAVAAGCLLSGVSLGASAARAAYVPPLLAWFDGRDPARRDDPAILEGVMREDAAPSAFGVAVTVDVTRVDSRPTRGGVRLSISGAAAPDRAGAWRAGRTLRLPALLRHPAAYGDPGLPDERRSLARRGIVLVGSVKSAVLVDVVAQGSALEEAAAAARAWARRRLAQYVGQWSAQSGAIAAAILIGDRSGISDEDERRLQEAGTFHVIAISGGNIAILTAILLLGMRAVRVPPRVAAAIAIAVLLFYGQLTGAGASVSRAVAAACVYLGGRMLDHRGPALNALAVAAIAGVAASPLAAFDAGFLLSFGATLGILVGTPRMERSAARTVAPPAVRGGRGSVLRRSAMAARAAAGALFMATACAELALAPIGAELFSRITLAGLILNFAAIPLMTVVQTASMATLAAAPAAGGVARVAGWVTHLAASWLVRSAQLVDVAPWLSRDVSPPAWWLVVAYYAACAAWLVSPRLARAGICGIALSAGIMLVSPPAATSTQVPAAARGLLRVVFLDVGQGDATLARMPDGRTILIDTGGLPGSAFDIGERVLAPSLRAFGVRRLDTLILTHGDPDHIGGAPAAIRRFVPVAVWEGVPVPPHERLRELAAMATTAHASWRTVQAGDRELAGAVEIRVLHPPPPEWERQRVRNDDSVVIELRMGDVSVVLPGDIGGEGERTLLPRLAVGAIAIVKAPHHGSATSSTPPFIKAAHPAVVVFSAGRGNRFGHPAPVVVSRYRTAGALILRTDEDGAVVVDTDGKRVEITTWSGRRVTLPH